jgi:hypothetical protein
MPGLTAAARDLTNGRWRDRRAELDELAVNPTDAQS